MIWHGNALNNFIELEDAALFNFSLHMAKRLNKRYNKSHGTLAGKHTDVPGMSRSAIPLLAANGILGYHIGYNGACKKPESLPPIFRWQHEESGTEVVLMAEGNYGTRIHAPRSSSLLAFMYQIDNTGPPTASDVLAFWGAVRAQYPNAEAISSSLDAYVADIVEDKDVYDSLPTIAAGAVAITSFGAMPTANTEGRRRIARPSPIGNGLDQGLALGTFRSAHAPQRLPSACSEIFF